MDTQTVNLMVGSGGIVFTVVMFLITWLKDGRARRWAEEDRRRIAAEQKAEQVQTAVELSKVTLTAHKDIAARVDANTQLSKEAFKEANGHNQKILNLTQTVAAVPVAAAAAAVIAVAQATTPTTLIVEAAKNPNPDSP